MRNRISVIFFALLVLAIGSTGCGDAQQSERTNLMALVDQYLAALETKDTSNLPLAENVKFTENGKELAVGEGFWATAGKPLLKITLIDTQQDGVHIQAVMEEPYSAETVGAGTPQMGGMPAAKAEPKPAEGTIRPILFAARLKVENEKITEIETIIARENEFAMNLPGGGAEGVLATKDQDWDTILPIEQRTPRQVMIDAADKYFDMFAEEPTVSVPFAKVCDRWENGFQTTKGGSFAGGPEMPAHDCSPKGLVISNHGPRRFLVDEEKGLVVAYVHFAGGLPDCHISRMKDGEVDLIQAVIGAGSQSMGWPNEPIEEQ